MYRIEQYDTVEHGWFYVSSHDTEAEAIEAIEQFKGEQTAYRVVHIVACAGGV